MPRQEADASIPTMVMTAVALYEIGKYGLVLSGQNVLYRTFKRFSVGDIYSELFAESKKISPRIPIAVV